MTARSTPAPGNSVIAAALEAEEAFPNGIEPQFVKLRARRTVHVIGDRTEPFRNLLDQEMTQAELLAYGPIATRCGQVIRQHLGGLQDNAHGIDAFPDEDLCRACYRTVPASERGRLFEHPQAKDEDEAAHDTGGAHG